MINDTEAFERFHSAFEVDIPPGAALRLRTLLLESLAPAVGALPARTTGRRRRHIPLAFRIGLRLAAAWVLIALVLSTTALFIATHHATRQNAPANSGPKSHATTRSTWGMMDARSGWQESYWRDPYGIRHITRTTDGGAHWTDVTPSYLANLTFPDEPQLNEARYLLDANHVWVTEAVGSTGSMQFITFRTADGGTTWAEGEAIAAEGQDPVGANLYFLDPMQGWLLIYPKVLPNPVFGGALYRTTDGGLHWRRLASNSKPSSPDCFGWIAVAFASVSTGWLSDCDGKLLATHDGGLTWSPQTIPAAPAGLSCPCGVGTPVVLSPTNATDVIYGATPEKPWQALLVTADAGASWSVRKLPGETQSMVDFTDSMHGWTISGPSDLLSTSSNPPGVAVPLYRTEDGGLTWLPVQTSLPLVSSEGRVYDMYFVDAKNGFADRFKVTAQSPILPVEQHGQLLKTTDGGQTWSVIGPMLRDLMGNLYRS
jgi:photosystem II stability/assembly factor-like uncharacterized protein